MQHELSSTDMLMCACWVQEYADPSNLESISNIYGTAMAARMQIEAHLLHRCAHVTVPFYASAQQHAP